MLSKLEDIFGALNDFIYEHVDVPPSHKEFIQHSAPTTTDRIPETETRQESEDSAHRANSRSDVRDRTDKRDAAPSKKATAGHQSTSNRFKTLQQMRSETRNTMPPSTRRNNSLSKKIHGDNKPLTTKDRHDRSRERTPPTNTKFDSTEKDTKSAKKKDGFFGWPKKKEQKQNATKLERKGLTEEHKFGTGRPTSSTSISSSPIVDDSPIIRGRSRNQTAIQAQEKLTMTSPFKSSKVRIKSRDAVTPSDKIKFQAEEAMPCRVDEKPAAVRGRSRTRTATTQNEEMKPSPSKCPSRSKSRGRKEAQVEVGKGVQRRLESIDKEEGIRGRSRSRISNHVEDKATTQSRNTSRSKSRGRSVSQGRTHSQKGETARCRSKSKTRKDIKLSSQGQMERTMALTPRNSDEKLKKTGPTHIASRAEREATTHHTREVQRDCIIVRPIQQAYCYKNATSEIAPVTPSPPAVKANSKGAVAATHPSSPLCTVNKVKQSSWVDQNKRHDGLSKALRHKSTPESMDRSHESPVLRSHEAFELTKNKVSELKEEKERRKQSPTKVGATKGNGLPVTQSNPKRVQNHTLEEKKNQSPGAITDPARVLIATTTGIQLENGSKIVSHKSGLLNRSTKFSPSEASAKKTNNKVPDMNVPRIHQPEPKRGFFSLLRSSKGVSNVSGPSLDQQLAHRGDDARDNTTKQNSKESVVSVNIETQAQLQREMNMDVLAGEGHPTMKSPRTEKDFEHVSTKTSLVSSPVNGLNESKSKIGNCNIHDESAPTKLSHESHEEREDVRSQTNTSRGKKDGERDAENFNSMNTKRDADNHDSLNIMQEQVEKWLGKDKATMGLSSSVMKTVPTKKVQGAKTLQRSTSPQSHRWNKKMQKLQNPYSLEENSLVATSSDERKVNSGVADTAESVLFRRFSKSFSRSISACDMRKAADSCLHDDPNMHAMNRKQLTTSEKSRRPLPCSSDDSLSVSVTGRYSTEEGHEVISVTGQERGVYHKKVESPFSQGVVSKSYGDKGITSNEMSSSIPFQSQWMADDLSIEDCHDHDHDRYLVRT